MLIETLLICSLISQAPYYDCDNEWTIYIYDKTVDGACGPTGYACATYTPNTYDGEIHIPKDYNKLLVGVSEDGIETYCTNCTDWCGYNILWHELQHLVVREPKWCDVPE